MYVCVLVYVCVCACVCVCVCVCRCLYEAVLKEDGARAEPLWLRLAELRSEHTQPLQSAIGTQQHEIRRLHRRFM
jgi:hypothetical protein